MVTSEEFLKVEPIKITEPCLVNGVHTASGKIVELSGNDKYQLLGSKRGVKLTAAELEKWEKRNEKPATKDPEK